MLAWKVWRAFGTHASFAGIFASPAGSLGRFPKLGGLCRYRPLLRAVVAGFPSIQSKQELIPNEPQKISPPPRISPRPPRHTDGQLRQLARQEPRGRRVVSEVDGLNRRRARRGLRPVSRGARSGRARRLRLRARG